MPLSANCSDRLCWQRSRRQIIWCRQLESAGREARTAAGLEAGATLRIVIRLTAPELFSMSAELSEHALQVVEFLAGLGQFTLRGQTLIIREVLTGLRNQRVDIGRGLGRA